MGYQTIRIDFPSLPKGVSLNHRSESYHPRSKAARAAREEAIAAAAEVGATGRGLAEYDLHLHFFLPTRHTRDPMGLVEKAKPWVDGLVQAGVLVDDSWREMTGLHVTHELRPGKPGTAIVILPR